MESEAEVRIHGAWLGLLMLGMTLHAGPASAQTLNPANGHHYQKFSGNLTWFAAQEVAASLSVNGIAGHLATITSAEENQFIVANLGDVNQCWLGGYQDRGGPGYSETHGGWRWVTDEAWSYTNWAPGEPNEIHEGEDYLEFRPPDGSWNDVRASWGSLGYIVEFDTPIVPRGDTPAVPEPHALGLFLPVLVGLCWIGRRRPTGMGLRLDRAGEGRRGRGAEGRDRERVERG